MTDTPQRLILTVGVVAERRPAMSQWVDAIWTPVQVLPDALEAAPFTSLGRIEDRERFYLGAASFEMYRSDTGHFADNFMQSQPKIWVSIRPTGHVEPAVELVAVTADPHEGEGFVDQVGDIVEAVPMPDEIARIVYAFYRENHVEQAFFKRQRDKHDPRKGGQRPTRGLDRKPMGGSEP